MTEAVILPKGERSLARLVAFVSALAKDKAWKVEISEHRARRSDEQNRYLWGVVYATVRKHLSGWDANDLHEYFLGEFFGWETLEGLGRKRLKPIRRSSKLNKTEFADYVGFIQRTMAEKGIYIPEPGEVTDGN
jgi:hypothetical protein